jgi:hypothetical protein
MTTTCEYDHRGVPAEHMDEREIAELECILGVTVPLHQFAHRKDGKQLPLIQELRQIAREVTQLHVIEEQR